MTMQLYTTRGRSYQIRLFWELLLCQRCGGAVKLTVNNEFEEIKVCKECGYRHVLAKKAKKNLGDYHG